MLRLLLLLPLVVAHRIGTDRFCYTVNQSIDLLFLNPSANVDDWVAVYRLPVDTNALSDFPSLWVWACGTQSCNRAVRQGIVTFGAGGVDESETDAWPLPVGNYIAVIAGGLAETHQARDIAEFRIANDCATTPVVNPRPSTPRPPTPPAPTLPPPTPPAPTPPAPTPPAPIPAANLVVPNMHDVIRRARNDIDAIIQRDDFFGPKFVRLAFHDCVGGCDGCIDVSNPDNAGLEMAMSVLRPVVDRYAREGLSRPDVWMLSALVGLERTAGGRQTFPMHWVGRKTCQELRNGNCGFNFRGQPSACTFNQGPHHDVCHGDVGTSTILEFFQENFGFNAQQTVALMGAHSIGAMRAENVGFEAPSGWDLSNDILDQGWYVELVGTGQDDPIVDVPNWQFEVQRNGNLRNIPDRPQWTFRLDGVTMKMLHTDICFVRELTEGVNLDSQGRPTCTFKGPNACPISQRTISHMQRYANSRTLFLNDFREVMTLMIENGYRRPGACPPNQVCRLQED